MNMAESLNLGCLCSTLHPELLRLELERMGIASLGDAMPQNHPNLFSATPVFLSGEDWLVLERSVAALHRVTAAQTDSCNCH